jgi:hypothetical protein
MSHTDVGDEVLVTHEVRDLEGELANAATVTLTVTLPDLTTEQPPIANPSTGLYEVPYTLTQAGRYVFLWTTIDPDTADAIAIEATEPGALPTLQAVKDYLEESATQWTDAQLMDALAAEAAAQARVCRTGPEYPADLREALLRRVQVNLAKRALPLGVLQGDSEAGTASFVPGKDPEVRRLEGPHRKLVIG